ncbi:hypothetical protein [Streptomyces sp. NPDC091294]|uniref:hypothetical protein n=1 Tax=Streptomyces sp. NPDC091294 TaxID=3365992 RepID=UPI0038265F71
MARSQNKYADFEGLRERAVAPRRAGYSLRQIRDELKVFKQRQQTKEAAARDIGALSDRDPFLVGVALYWAEGTKDNYRGCLVLTVRQSAEFYRRVEGWWTGIVADAVTRLR